MGIAIAVIYLPALVLVSAIAIALSRISIRAVAQQNTILARKALAYAGGALCAILITTTYAWWYSIRATNEWAPVIGSLAISLLGPPLVGVVLWFVVGRIRPGFLAYVPAGAFHATLAMPVVGALFIAFYDDVVYGPKFKQLCSAAQVSVLEKIEPPKSIVLAPDAFFTSNAKGHGRQSLGDALICNYKLEFVETQVVNPQGAIIRQRLTPISATPNCSERGQISRTPIETITAEYEVVPARLVIADDFSKRMHGQRIEIHRASDMKMIAYAQYYWDSGKFWECPVGVGQPRYITDFIVDALRISRR
jgi:hypothetical protein